MSSTTTQTTSDERREATKPAVSFDLIEEWAEKAMTNCKSSGRKEAAQLWADCLDWLRYQQAELQSRPVAVSPLDALSEDAFVKFAVPVIFAEADKRPFAPDACLEMRALYRALKSLPTNNAKE